MSSSQDFSGNCIIQNLCQKKRMDLGAHSVPLENLHKVIYSSWMFNRAVKSPCQSIQSGFWNSIRAEMASSWLQHLSQIPRGHQSLQQLHCLQGNLWGVMEAFFPSTAPPADFSWGRDDLSPCDLGFSVFTLTTTVVHFPSGSKEFCFSAAVEQLLIVSTKYISVPKFRLLL